jgi:tRNA (mo5U34)-methyltransferase
MTPDEIQSGLAKLGWWYHNIDLGHGIWTNPSDPRAYDPQIRWRLIEPYVLATLDGKTVLDLGCACGYFSVMMKKRGARRVLGIDLVEGSINQAKFLADVYNVDVDFRVEDVYHFCLTNEEVFDYVLFLGLFYHLRHPLLVLDHVAAITRERLYFQSIVRGASHLEALEVKDDYPHDEQNVFENREFPKMFFIEKLLNKDPTNWWVANGPGLEGILRSAGLEIIQRLGIEEFVCKPIRKPGSMKICEHAWVPVITKNMRSANKSKKIS